MRGYKKKTPLVIVSFSEIVKNCRLAKYNNYCGSEWSKKSSMGMCIKSNCPLCHIPADCEEVKKYDPTLVDEFLQNQNELVIQDSSHIAAHRIRKIKTKNPNTVDFDNFSSCCLLHDKDTNGKCRSRSQRKRTGICQIDDCPLGKKSNNLFLQMHECICVTREKVPCYICPSKEGL